MMAALSQPEVVGCLVLCGAFVLLSGVFSGAETGLYCLNRLHLRLAAHENEPAAVRLQKLVADQAGLLFTTLLGTNVANYLAPVCLTAVFLAAASPSMSEQARHVLEQRAELLTTVLLTPVLFIFGEVVPKNVFQKRADQCMRGVAAFLAGAYWFARETGMIGLQRRISNFVTDRLHRQPAFGSALHPRLAMYQMLREGAAEGALTAAQMFMLQRIPTLRALRVASVMTPRSSVVMLNVAASRREILEIIRRSPYSRLPVYRGARTNVIGTVHVLDVLTSPADAPLTGCLQPVIALGHTSPLITALTILQRSHRRMAIVVDPSGRCLGLATVKDLVEEIVGELAAW
jgi:CBS domain containing-hemolysin-like protein